MRTLIKNFSRDEGGNFAMMVALAGMVLLTGVGVAVDMQGVAKREMQLQNLADMAALAAITSGETDKDTLEAIALDMITNQNLKGWVLEANAKLTGTQLDVTIAHSYNTMIMGIVGQDTVPLNVKSEAIASKATRPVDIAFVLDRTASMDGGNMTSLKTAAKGLVDDLDSIPGNNVRMSVVPFANHVNVGLSNLNAPWMHTDLHNTTETIDNCRDIKPKDNPGLCTMETHDSVTDGIVTGTYEKEVCPPEAYGDPVMTCTPYDKSYVWNGCAGSRLTPHNTDPAFGGMKIPGPMNYTCGEEILPLTDNLESVDTRIQSLTASGETYIPAGLMWGWRTLDPNIPYDQAAPFDPDRKRAIILMTDGANTKHQVGHDHTGNSAITGENFALDLCNLIKQDDITIYTVAYNFPTTDRDGKALMQSCASGPEDFFDAQTSAQLTDAFDQIGNNLAKETARLSR